MLNPKLTLKRWAIKLSSDAPIKDNRKITVTISSKDKFIIDFDVTMEMLMDEKIENPFSGRMVPDLAVIKVGTMISAECETAEKGTIGKSSAWIEFLRGPPGKN